MVSTLIAAASMTACSSQPSETTTAETTAAESTQENDTSAESSDASETTTAGEKETSQTTDADHAEDETLSRKRNHRIFDPVVFARIPSKHHRQIKNYERF